MGTSSYLLRRLLTSRRCWSSFFLRWHSCFTSSLSLPRHSYASAFTFLNFLFHAADFNPHTTGHIYFLLFHISHLKTVDSYHLCSILFHLYHLLSHSFRGESPHLSHLLFILSKYFCYLLVDSTPCIFCIIIVCIHLIFHFISLTAGITPCFFHCISWLIPCLSQLLLQTMHLLTPILTFSLHHLFQHVNLFLAGVNVTLVILCLIVCLGFEVLDIVLQIYHYTIISRLSNYLGPFFLVVILVWNGCILALNRFILVSFSPLYALLLHFYLMTSCLWGFSCGWNLRNILLLKVILFAWATAQYAGPFGHDSGVSEFTIGSFIEWHILCASRRW